MQIKLSDSTLHKYERTLDPLGLGFLWLLTQCEWHTTELSSDALTEMPGTTWAELFFLTLALAPIEHRTYGQSATAKMAPRMQQIQ